MEVVMNLTRRCAGFFTASLIWFLAFPPAAFAQARVSPSPSPAAQPTAKPSVYDETADARVEIAAALKKAQTDGKRVLVVFGANWCGDCLVLDRRFHEDPAGSIVEKNFHVVHVDIGRWDKNKDLAEKYQVPLDKGVPAIAVLDQKGALLFSQRNGEFEPAARLGVEPILEFLNRWKVTNK
jgi:thiol:disulfide interchange protein